MSWSLVDPFEEHEKFLPVNLSPALEYTGGYSSELRYIFTSIGFLNRNNEAIKVNKIYVKHDTVDTFQKKRHVQYERLRAHSQTSLHSSHILMPFCDHLLQQPSHTTPTYFIYSSQSTGSTFSQPPSHPASRLHTPLPTNNPHIKKYNPYLEVGSENILTLTLSQAPAFVCLYICTQSLNAAVLLLFVGTLGFHCSPTPLENTVYASD